MQGSTLKFGLVNISLSFTPLPRNTSFLIVKHSCAREELSDAVFFLQKSLQQIIVQKHILVILHSRPSPLVRAPPQLTLFSSYTNFRLCPFLPASPSATYPFLRKMISNDFNTRSTYLIILAEEGVPIFNFHIRLIPLVIYFGVQKTVGIILSSSSVPSPSKTKCTKTQ